MLPGGRAAHAGGARSTGTRFPAEALDRCFELFREAPGPARRRRASWATSSSSSRPGSATTTRRSTTSPRCRRGCRAGRWPWSSGTRPGSRSGPTRSLRFLAAARPRPRVRRRAVAAVRRGRDDAPSWAVLRLHGRNVQGWLDQLAGREPTRGREVRLPVRPRGAGRARAPRPAAPPPRPARRGHVQQQQPGLPDPERARPQAPARARGAGPRRRPRRWRPGRRRAAPSRVRRKRSSGETRRRGRA